MKASHLVFLLSSIALFAWTRPTPPRPEEPRGLLELRYDLLSLNLIRPGSSVAEVRSRMGKPIDLGSLADGSEIWTYRDPESVTTVYFNEGKATGISGAGQIAQDFSYQLKSRAGVERVFGPPQQKTASAWTYRAGTNELTFVFLEGCYKNELAKITLSQAPWHSNGQTAIAPPRRGLELR